MKRQVSADLTVCFRGTEYSVKAVPHVLVGEHLEICLYDGKVCAAYSYDDDRPETVYLPLPEVCKQENRQENWFAFKGETCCALREDSRLDMEVANSALAALHALLLDNKSAKTKSWNAEGLADIIGCISERLARAVNETEEINRAA